MMRGIRGAITVVKNSKHDILSATVRLLAEMIHANQVKAPDIASIIFSATRDLNAEFPARAAREIGLNQAPLMCTVEINVPKSLRKCIRILMHVNSQKKQGGIRHIYLEGAKSLRKEFSS